MKALSIRRQVLLWTLGALAVGAAVMIVASWLSIRNEMEEVFADNLKQVALAVAHHHRPGVQMPPRLAQELPRIYEQYGPFEFVTAVWSRDGALLATSAPEVALPFLARSGMSQAEVGGQRWHLYTVVLEDSIVQAAQRASEREVLAGETAVDLALPALGVVAVLAALILLALGRGLRPLSRAAGEVALRSARSLHPIALDEQPAELQPLVKAINELMARLGHALTLQRDFLADAAHELRTPIAALGLQAQLLARASEPAQRAAALSELKQGIERGQQVVERLLQLSRVAPDGPPMERAEVPLAALVRDAVARFSSRAEARGVDLGAVSDAAPVVWGDATALSMLVDNLVDNALRHVGEGGRVDVAAQLQDGSPCLVVTDNGPGISKAERDRVFDRFYRGQAPVGYGSGLGLAIVKAVADRHGAQTALDDAPGGGLRVTVRFASPAR